MTFAELQSSVFEDCNYASSPAAAVVTRIKKYLNDAIKTLVAEPGMIRLLDSDSPLTFASVVSQARYVLPESVAQIRHVSERTNNRTLALMDLDRYRLIESNPVTFTGIPSHVVPFGRTAVAMQPSDASSIFVKSDNAADTTQTAFIEGLITGGYVRTSSVTLNGTVAANLASSISTFIEITDFYLSAAGAGTITLLEDSGAGTELARITIGALRPRYLGIYLWPTPAAVVTYYVDYRRVNLDLVNSTDEPPGPVECHAYYAAYARMREYEKTDDDRFKLAAKECLDWKSRLKYAVLENPEHLPLARRSANRVGHSRLGGQFPADYYTWG